ncbi:MAG: glycoside hydrolase family 3 protein [Spirochaetaceae bacterium]|nr:glycoside hydrolase family 3 protein [Spirochaetaceae bacterium]
MVIDTQTYPTDTDAIASAMADSQLNFWSDYPHDILAAAITEKMTDEELLAQLFMFGWHGQEPTPFLLRWIRERSLGSVKIFGWNSENLDKIIESVNTVQTAVESTRFKIPLFVATDQEGGWIRHVKGETSVTPGNMAIGASSVPADAYYSAFYISRELRALGINMNFAPTIDIFTDYDSTIIGSRSFGEDAEAVGILGAAFIAGATDAGLLSTAKHFPGHGDTSLDSHGYLPVINISKETFYDREILPFRHAIDENVAAIMSGHLSFPRVSGTKEPASLSTFYLQEILRKELNFKGLIITDDMQMNGAVMYAGNFSEAVHQAIAAGNQILCASITPDLDSAMWVKNLSLMATDEKFRSIVKKSAYGVIVAKLQYFKHENSVPIFPDGKDMAEKIPDKEGTDFFLDQAVRSITLKKGDFFPIDLDKAGRILLVGQFDEFFEAGKRRFPDANQWSYNYSIGPIETLWNLDHFPAFARNYDTIITCVATEESLRITRRLRYLGKKVIVVSALSPIFVEDLDWADTILLAYSYSGFSFEAAFAALAGDFVPTGEIPFKDTDG